MASAVARLPKSPACHISSTGARKSRNGASKTPCVSDNSPIYIINMRMRQIGVAILILNFALIGIVILAIVLGRRVHYPGITIHITAIYDIVVVILAASRVLKHGATDSPVVISSKCLNLTLAMLAILSLTSAAVVQYGASILVRRIVVGIVGGAICVINILLARYMIRLGQQHM